ncbi:hypothetical protein NLG97_g8201 [Lecanicillium saksenae]|uniref:Uncharacterized protein n=1 Tax=Lecanicillium saksenae TaxID=468837 RepID=A0ACC1QML0_9HYPO|nr:hypothetical protein NLG97_g8201 [Lecanicillium saksenae]
MVEITLTILGLDDLERPSHGITPIRADVVRNGLDHARAGVLKDPKVAAAMQQHGKVGEDDEGLGPVLAQDVDVLCRDDDGEGGDGVLARVGGQVVVQVKRPLELLDGDAAGLEAGGREVGAAEEVVGGARTRGPSRRCRGWPRG